MHIFNTSILQHGFFVTPSVEGAIHVDGTDGAPEPVHAVIHSVIPRTNVKQLIASAPRHTISRRQIEKCPRNYLNDLSDEIPHLSNIAI